MVSGGETTTIKLGSISFNIAPSLEKNPTESVILVNEETGKTYVTLHHHGNGYYLFKPKPVPQGSYNIQIQFSRCPDPSTLARNIRVTEGKDTVITIDSGFKLKKPQGMKLKGWDLLPVEEGSDAGIITKRRWDNEYPLWEVFPVVPGTYNLILHVDGMTEPLPAADSIQINKGDLVDFDTGL
jgi:hypothetical protein